MRDGRLAFGVQPVIGGPVIDMRAEPIVASSNIAANFRNDTVQIRFQNTAGTRVAYLQTSAASDHTMQNENALGGWAFGAANVTRFYVGRGGAANVEPGANNTTTLGSASLRWSEVYAVNGTINTSDEREKQQIRDLLEQESAVARRLKTLVRAYKWNSSPEGPWHFGVIAQEVVNAFTAEGLDYTEYGVVRHDFLDDGSDRYGVNYAELTMFIISVI